MPTTIMENGMHSLMFNLSLNTTMAIMSEKTISLLLKMDAFTADEFCNPKKYTANAATSDNPIRAMNTTSFCENLLMESVFRATGVKNIPHIM